MFKRRMISDYLLSSRVKTVVLPASVHFDGANFQRIKDDLIIGDKRGSRAFIRDFFNQEMLPSIASEDGEIMLGELAAAFVRLSPRAVSALLEIDKVQRDQTVSMDTAS